METLLSKGRGVNTKVAFAIGPFACRSWMDVRNALCLDSGRHVDLLLHKVQPATIVMVDIDNGFSGVVR